MGDYNRAPGEEREHRPSLMDLSVPITPGPPRPDVGHIVAGRTVTAENRWTLVLRNERWCWPD